MSKRDELIEAMASMVHMAMRFERMGTTPPWQNGNSLAEDEARKYTSYMLETLKQQIPNFEILLDGSGVVVPLEPTNRMITAMCVDQDGVKEFWGADMAYAFKQALLEAAKGGKL